MSKIDGTFGALMPMREPRPSGRIQRRPRVVIYSHDTLGFGHLRRNILLASALKKCNRSPDILLIAGMREACAFAMPDGVDCLSLPGYAKLKNGSYTARDLDISVGALREIRSATIRAAVENFKPDLMIVDNVPRGAQYELDPTLRSLKRAGKTHVILGLRDIIDRPTVMRQQWLRQRNFEALREFYSGIWVYGDPHVYATAKEYNLGPELTDLVTYTGYLDQTVRLNSKAAPLVKQELVADDPRQYILCTVGGGSDGFALSEAFVKADLPKDHRGILVTGTQMSATDRCRIKQFAMQRKDMVVKDFVQEPVGLAAGAAATVSMCGYNTASEVMSLNLRALFVPRVSPRAEQLIRAERLQELGIAEMLHPGDLSADAITAWLAKIPRCDARQAPVDLNGLTRIRDLANIILESPLALSRAV